MSRSSTPGSPAGRPGAPAGHRAHSFDYTEDEDEVALDPALVTSPGHGAVGVFQAPRPVSRRTPPAEPTAVSAGENADIDSPSWTSSAAGDDPARPEPSRPARAPASSRRSRISRRPPPARHPPARFPSWSHRGRPPTSPAAVADPSSHGTAAATRPPSPGCRTRPVIDGRCSAHRTSPTRPPAAARRRRAPAPPAGQPARCRAADPPPRRQLSRPGPRHRSSSRRASPHRIGQPWSARRTGPPTRIGPSPPAGKSPRPANAPRADRTDRSSRPGFVLRRSNSGIGIRQSSWPSPRSPVT